MDIDVIYSKADPRQCSTRDFVYRFVRERGIRAHIYEHEEHVAQVILVVDGVTLKEKRHQPRSEDTAPYPTIEVIAQTLEQHAWS